ncbi:hypothetical protein FEM48_Zijuj01G0116700 [Ziziphus jujuba var. spinosa]|uniref:Cytochrome c-553 n=1 Tax=Ziziphus jujuba var. spinosa TaxID=714518 RepID=A0A978W123_ZIZJJ|nr:hypothetical protein FEM48_Zijuj01G0116700 [Ziziphus jujuba var. spinosa]
MQQLSYAMSNTGSSAYYLSTKGNVKTQQRQSIIGKNDDGKVKLLKSLLAPPLMAAFLTLSPICSTPESVAETVEVQRGSTLFRRACIGCHDAGGNIIQPIFDIYLVHVSLLSRVRHSSQKISKDSLNVLSLAYRNGVDTEEEIYRITYFGKGRMPGFGENCTPKGQCTFGARLQDTEIKLLAEFVKSQADQGWPNIESNED